MADNNYIPQDATPKTSRLPLRELFLFGMLLVTIVGVYGVMGPAYSTRMLVEAACYAILALGLTIRLRRAVQRRGHGVRRPGRRQCHAV